MWAAGVTLYFLLSRALPLDGEEASSVLRKVRAAKFNFSPPAFRGVSPAAKSLIRALLQPSRRKRPTAASVLLHRGLSALCEGCNRQSACLSSAPRRAPCASSSVCRSVAVPGARGGWSVTTISDSVDVAPRAKTPASPVVKQQPQYQQTYGLPARMPPSRISNSSTAGQSSTGSRGEEQPPNMPFFLNDDEYSSPAKRANSGGMLSRVSKIKRAISFRGYEAMAQAMKQ